MRIAVAALCLLVGGCAAPAPVAPIKPMPAAASMEDQIHDAYSSCLRFVDYDQSLMTPADGYHRYAFKGEWAEPCAVIQEGYVAGEIKFGVEMEDQLKRAHAADDALILGLARKLGESK